MTMTDSKLIDLLGDMESDRVERKESISDPGKIRQAVCAFANDMPNHGQPGVLFIGVRDDGSCADLEITDQLLKTLADIRSDGNILPLPTMTVQKKNLKNCEMAVVVVQPAHSPPVRYKGRVWIRVGPRRATASLEEESRLNEKRRAGDLPYAPVQLTWFRDRIEIQNPGGSFGRVTCQNFGTLGRTDYRNPNVAEAMKTLGFVQRFGAGLQIARQALEDNGNPPPEFELEENNILVTIRSNQ